MTNPATDTINATPAEFAASMTTGSAVSNDVKHEESVAPAAKNILEDLGVNASLLAVSVSSKFSGLINSLQGKDKSQGREF